MGPGFDLFHQTAHFALRGQAVVAEFLSTFNDYPPRLGSSLSVDTVLKQLTEQGRVK